MEKQEKRKQKELEKYVQDSPDFKMNNNSSSEDDDEFIRKSILHNQNLFLTQNAPNPFYNECQQFSVATNEYFDNVYSTKSNNTRNTEKHLVTISDVETPNLLSKLWDSLNTLKYDVQGKPLA